MAKIRNLGFPRVGKKRELKCALFRIGRGRAPTGCVCAASEMTKWFNSSYHYLLQS
ncbi:hypothetical protein [Pseudoalteromonas aurantia]|uniref:Cobalamin-independent methionine synthase MetE N-terminal domain-containing protein n=1 Tax=Pseudoalteromonas aurantia TaxID=43654 RepID=A0ABY2W1G0_9GAMM|nr:hypothetical protein [Pseudoalteromonas aurantia]TMO64515.1 hypothetical protein CWC18_06480 [Pseudoalteromonas aurantia]TMO77686.1 hypothetical protein CWC20_03610 [Pseudoalteromonas aurantia]